MEGEFIKKKFFSMALSILTAITMSCSVLLIMPVSNQAAYSLPVKEVLKQFSHLRLIKSVNC